MKSNTKWRVDGAKLKALRLAKGMTQADVERILNCASSYVAHVETCEDGTNMRVDRLYRLASIFGCEIQDLVSEQG